jgi:NAD(P)-dependent dehydrogenase (short-subunit alcohol dehydrogenase family)/acyl carrier protein
MAGVDEIACQMDFGIDIELVLQSLPSLNLLKERCQPETPPEPTPASQSSSSQSVRSTFASSVQERESFSPVQQSNPLQEIQQRCQQEIFPLAFYSSLQAHGVQLAESFRGIEQLWSGNGEALGRIQIPSTLEKEIDAYQIHPTLLDACFQVLIAALPIQMDANGEGTLYLPTALRSFRVHHRPGRRVWSHALLSSNADPSASSFEGDVCLLDDTGQLLVEARGLLLQRSELSVPSRHQDDLSDWLYELRWEPKSLETRAALSTERSQRWLLFIDSSGVGQQLANLLAAQGDSCIKVVPGYTYQVVQQGKHYRINPSQPEHMHRLLKDVQTSGAFYGVVHLWSLDTTSSHETTVATLETDSALGAGSALSLIQALAALQQSRQPRLWFVTQGAQPVGPGPSSLQVGQSPLWGLGRTCAIEHPELWGGLVDVDPHERADASAKPLLTVLSSEHGDDQIAFRQGQSYVARMVRSTNWARRLLELHADASYLITGGLWGLGFEVARWMARKGARHLVLLGRSQLPPRTSWDSVNPESRTARQIAGIRELEASGVQVHYASVDVADEEQLRALLQTLRDQHIPAVRGIIHAASVWQDTQGQSLVRPLIHLDPAALKAVFQPKVMGSWLLYKLFQDTKLDFFVSFSSGASLFGSAAQGNYAAAGAFLDALAHHMRAGGQPALSIDWGAVSETGFGATPEGLRVHEYWESHGIQRITPKHVLAALELLIPQNTSQVGVLKLDWRLLLQFYPQLAQLPLVSALTTEFTDGRVPRETVHAESTLLEKLAPREHAERQQLIEAYLCEKVAGVLRLAPAKIDVQQPLTVLGLDSLMAIELKNRIELELQVHIPIVTFLQGPSIQQFAAQLLNQLAEMTPIPSASSRSPAGESAELSAGSPLAPMRQDEAEQLLTQAEQLSGDEVRALLSALSQQGQTGATDGLSRADAAQLLAQLDQLSDSEVDALLKHIVQEEGLDR